MSFDSHDGGMCKSPRHWMLATSEQSVLFERADALAISVAEALLGKECGNKVGISDEGFCYLSLG